MWKAPGRQFLLSFTSVSCTARREDCLQPCPMGIASSSSSASALSPHNSVIFPSSRSVPTQSSWLTETCVCLERFVDHGPSCRRSPRVFCSWLRVPAENSCTQRWKSCRSQLWRRSLGRVSQVTHGFPRSASRRWEWVEPWTHESTKFVKSTRPQWLRGPPL